MVAKTAINLADHLAKCNMNRGVAKMKTFTPLNCQLAEKKANIGCQQAKEWAFLNEPAINAELKLARQRLAEGWHF